MSIYSVNLQGVVVAATKLVDVKTKELVRAHEELALAKVMRQIQSLQGVEEFESTVTPVKQKTVKKPSRATGSVKVGKARLTLLTIQWCKLNRVTVSTDNVINFLKILGATDPKRFGWCKELRVSSVENLVKHFNNINK